MNCNCYLVQKIIKTFSFNIGMWYRLQEALYEDKGTRKKYYQQNPCAVAWSSFSIMKVPHDMISHDNVTVQPSCKAKISCKRQVVGQQR